MNLGDRIRNLSPQAQILGAIAIVVVVISLVVGAIVWGTTHKSSEKNSRIGNPNAPYVTTRPQETIPPKTPEQQKAFDDEMARTGGGDDPSPTPTDPNAGAHPSDIEDMSDKLIPVAQLGIYYPRIPGQINDVDYRNVNAMASDVFRARMTGAGRASYPQLFPGSITPDPRENLVTNFAVDYVSTTATPGQPGMYRSIVVWHGTGDIVDYQQVRRALYSTRRENGTFSPIMDDSLPDEIRRTDSMLNGISITKRK